MYLKDKMSVSCRYLAQGVYFLLLLCLSTTVFSQGLPETETRAWLREHLDFTLQKITHNISLSDTAKGAVIAATSKSHPDYYYHWVRDAGIVMDSLVSLYRSNISPDKKQLIRTKLFEYVDFSKHIQQVPTISGLGEPKFNVDGSANNEPWGRPQNDSPAMRAISLIHWAQALLADGEDQVVRKQLYNSTLPATSPIKMDLEYLSYHWRDASFDLWEEVKGSHFYTFMVERRALLDGAKLAHQLGDEGASRWYYRQGKDIEKELQNFWDADRQYLVATLNQEGGLEYKYSNLDTATILGLLHGDRNDGFLTWDDPRVLATMEHIKQSFATLYAINHHAEIPGTAIGRYPEDKYAGDNFDNGNPWPLCTLALSEAYYRYGQLLLARDNISKAKEVTQGADQLINRVRYHAHRDGSLSEQIHRDTGYMISATDLTWNYAALLTVRNAALHLRSN